MKFTIKSQEMPELKYSNLQNKSTKIKQIIKGWFLAENTKYIIIPKLKGLIM